MPTSKAAISDCRSGRSSRCPARGSSSTPDQAATGSQRFSPAQNEEDRYRSPLTEVGVDVHVGDYVLAINGRELKAGTDPYELLQAPANQPVEWRVSADRGRQSRAHHSLPPLGTRNRARVSGMGHRQSGSCRSPEPGPARLYSYSRHGRCRHPRIHQVVVPAGAQGRTGGRCARQWRRQCLARC